MVYADSFPQVATLLVSMKGSKLDNVFRGKSLNKKKESTVNLVSTAGRKYDV